MIRIRPAWNMKFANIRTRKRYHEAGTRKEPVPAVLLVQRVFPLMTKLWQWKVLTIDIQYHSRGILLITSSETKLETDPYALANLPLVQREEVITWRKRVNVQVLEPMRILIGNSRPTITTLAAQEQLTYAALLMSSASCCQQQHTRQISRMSRAFIPQKTQCSDIPVAARGDLFWRRI